MMRSEKTIRCKQMRNTDDDEVDNQLEDDQEAEDDHE